MSEQFTPSEVFSSEVLRILRTTKEMSIIVKDSYPELYTTYCDSAFYSIMRNLPKKAEKLGVVEIRQSENTDADIENKEIE